MADARCWLFPAALALGGVVLAFTAGLLLTLAVAEL